MARKAKKAKAQDVEVLAGDSQVIEALSSEEKRELKKCESVIKHGWETFVDVGRALVRIQKDRLYRAAHRTFEAYCRTRWQYGKSQAYRLIGAAEVIEHLSPIGDKLPLNEAQVRPLLGLEPDEQVKAWKAVLENADGKAVTAKFVREAAAAYQSTKRKVSRPKAQRKQEPSEALRLVDEALSALAAQNVDRARTTLETLRAHLAA